jgi:hypothetical protein
MSTDPDLVRPYIEGRLAELGSWDILFPSLGREDSESLIDTSLGFRIVCQRRSIGEREIAGGFMVTNKQRVASRGMERNGLMTVQVRKAEDQYRREHDKTNYPDHIYRLHRSRPLLIVHLLAMKGKTADYKPREPVVAWSISFPQTQKPEKRVEYVVNTSWMQENLRDELDDYEADDDELS